MIMEIIYHFDLKNGKVLSCYKIENAAIVTKDRKFRLEERNESGHTWQEHHQLRSRVVLRNGQDSVWRRRGGSQLSSEEGPPWKADRRGRLGELAEYDVAVVVFIHEPKSGLHLRNRTGIVHEELRKESLHFSHLDSARVVLVKELEITAQRLLVTDRAHLRFQSYALATVSVVRGLPAC